jgi:hypothetical protein
MSDVTRILEAIQQGELTLPYPLRAEAVKLHYFVGMTRMPRPPRSYTSPRRQSAATELRPRPALPNDSGVRSANPIFAFLDQTQIAEEPK